MTQKTYAKLGSALPFWAVIPTIPILGLSAYLGGWWLLMTYVYAWILFGFLDAFTGLYTANVNPETDDDDLFWYRLVTLIWFPLQCVATFAAIYAVTHFEYTAWEKFGLMASVGILAGAVGIVFAHELMHQRPKFERHLGDALMAMALYGHFRSEHMLVHHRYVGTPKCWWAVCDRRGRPSVRCWRAKTYPFITGQIRFGNTPRYSLRF